MSARITITATEGPCKGREFVFTTRTVCTVGRSDVCLPALYSYREHVKDGGVM